MPPRLDDRARAAGDPNGLDQDRAHRGDGPPPSTGAALVPAPEARAALRTADALGASHPVDVYVERLRTAVSRETTERKLDMVARVLAELWPGSVDLDHVRGARYGVPWLALTPVACERLRSALADRWAPATANAALAAIRGVLRTQYTDAQEATYTDPEGKPRSIVMGSFGIGLGRLLGCLAEEHHDERGLTLPVAIAPYEVLIVCLPDSQEVIERAEQLYTALSATGLEVLYDDRPKKMASPGERFNDADLIGIPVRLTVSERSLRNGGVEMKRRRGGEVEMVGFEEVLGKVRP